MNYPLVSIIVPVYNVKPYLTRCVQSLTNQTLEEIEIILVDDGSTDGSSQICDSFAQSDTRIKVIHKSNEGQGIARNYGLEVATGEYVTFIDSDDWVDLSTYEVCYKTSQEKELDICYFRYCRATDNRTYTELNFLDKPEFFMSNNEVRGFLLDVFGLKPADKKGVMRPTSACMAIFRRSLIEENNIRFLSERKIASEDKIFISNVIVKANRLAILPFIFYYYYVRQNSTSTSYDDSRLKKIYAYLDHSKKFLAENFLFEIYKGHFMSEMLLYMKYILRYESKQDIPITKRFKRVKQVCSHPILDLLYNDDERKDYRLYDRLYIFCMKHRLAAIFLLMYKLK